MLLSSRSIGYAAHHSAPQPGRRHLGRHSNLGAQTSQLACRAKACPQLARSLLSSASAHQPDSSVMISDREHPSYAPPSPQIVVATCRLLLPRREEEIQHPQSRVVADPRLAPMFSPGILHEGKNPISV